MNKPRYNIPRRFHIKSMNSNTEDLSEIVASINIVEYISQYIELTQKGDEWWGLSCFNEESTPSFSVRENPPFFYDFSSGIGGNLFSFVKAYHKCSNAQAAKIIKEYAGVKSDGTYIQKQKMRAVQDCRKYKAKEKRVKAHKGTVLQDDFMDRYQFDRGKLRAWTDEGISEESLKRFEVKYDAFSNSIVYPIRNLGGKIVNIGSRTLYPDYKERGLGKYGYFYKWGNLDLIYGLFENKEYVMEKKEIILFEGCKSVLIADTWGIKNCGAILTSHLNPMQMKALIALGVRVVFALDKEINIRSDENITTLKNYVNVEYLYDNKNYLEPKDAPVDKGKDVFLKLYDERRRFR